MKKIFTFTAIMVVLTASAFSQEPVKPITAYASAGLTFPNSPSTFQDFHKMGYNLYGGASFKSLSILQLIGKVEYHKIKKDWDYLTTEAVSGGLVKLWLFGVDSRLTFGAPIAPVKPFLMFGAGLANVSESSYNLVGSISVPQALFVNEGIKFYFNLGGGVDFNYGILSLFLQARMINIKQDDKNLLLVPINIGLRF